MDDDLPESLYDENGRPVKKGLSKLLPFNIVFLLILFLFIGISLYVLYVGNISSALRNILSIFDTDSIFLIIIIGVAIIVNIFKVKAKEVKIFREEGEEVDPLNDEELKKLLEEDKKY